MRKNEQNRKNVKNVKVLRLSEVMGHGPNDPKNLTCITFPQREAFFGIKPTKFDITVVGVIF